MALRDNLRTGTAEINKAAEGRGGGRFTPFISWSPGDSKIVYFLTPAEDIPRVVLHRFIEVPDDSRDDGVRKMTFMCRKDPAIREESGNYCELCDRIGHIPEERHVALALELEITDRKNKRVTGVAPAMRKYEDKDGVEHEVPQIGTIIQASNNFFKDIAQIHEKYGLDEVSVEISREAGDQSKTYFFDDIDAVPDLEGVEVPDLFDILEDWSSEERYAENLVDVQPGSQKQPFAKAKGGGTTAPRTRSNDNSRTSAPDLREQFQSVAERVKGAAASEAK